MINSYKQKFKDIFFLKVPAGLHGPFLSDSMNINNSRFFILPFFNLLSQLFCYVIYLYIYPVAYPNMPRINPTFFRIFSLIYITINIIFILLFKNINENSHKPNFIKKSKRILIAFLISYVILESIGSLVEIKTSGNLYHFLATFFVVAFLPIIPRLYRTLLLLFYAFTLDLGIYFLIQNGMSPSNRYIEIVLVCFAVCSIATNIVYTSSIKTFILKYNAAKTNKKLKKANDKLKKLAIIDPLTNISNRRAFNDYITPLWNLARREKTVLTVFMIDIDSFKSYNDNYGHQKGDEALIAVVNAIKANFTRSTDMLARYGGEEFVALLPHTLGIGVEKLADNVCKSVESLNITNDHTYAKKVTVSIGVASMIPQIESKYEDIIKAADDELYKSKLKGGNQISIAE